MTNYENPFSGKKKGKEIEFNLFIDDIKGVTEEINDVNASAYGNIKVISSDNKFDAFLAWDDGFEKEASVFLGHINDGIAPDGVNFINPFEKKGKPVEFIHCLNNSHGFTGLEEPNCAPCDYDNVKVISCGCTNYFDAFLAWNYKQEHGAVVYLGRVNDNFIKE